MDAPVDTTALARAYAAARYRVRVDGDTVGLCVGVPASDLEAYVPAARYALLTARNPESRPRGDAANRAADAVLASRLRALGIGCLRTRAEADDGAWPEDGWLLIDADVATAHALGREFGQAGVLAWARGEPVTLYMLLPRGEAGTAQAPWTVWIE